jgi:hypothetical protein
MEETKKCVVEKDSDAVIYILRSTEIGSGVQKVSGGIHRHTQISHDLIVKVKVKLPLCLIN